MVDDLLSLLGRARPSVQIGLGLSALWLVLVAIFLLLAGREGGLTVLPALMIVIAVVGPIILIATATLSVLLVEQSTEIADLRRALAARDRRPDPRPATGDAATKRVTQQLGEVTDRLTELETWLAERAHAIERADQLLSGVPATPVAAPDAGRDEVPDPDTGPAPGEGDAPLGRDLLTRALQFPEDADDREGFDALRAALRDRRAAQIVIAAQDVLTLLSQSGLYMDDLEVERAPVDLWRRFAAGDRGPEIAAIGGIRDEAALDRVAARMREDTIFRDAVHHFLRLFDQRLTETAAQSGDMQIAAFAETRSARAFMLLGRASGIFA